MAASSNHTGPRPTDEQADPWQWQKIVYGDTEVARAALAYWRERNWPVDANTFPERTQVETRIYAFIDGYKAAESSLRADLAALRQHVDICEHLIREHSDAASIFQPGGKYHKEADLPLGSSAVVEGIKWLDTQLTTLRAEKDTHVSRLNRRIDALQKATPAFLTDYQRMWDLVRHQRADLLDADLITHHEFALLVLAAEGNEPGSASPRRLESYDEQRARAEASRDALTAQVAALTEALRGPVLVEVIAERARQDAKWGGPDHDDTHTLFDWWGFMKARMIGRAYPGGQQDERRGLIQIAALAIAAVESLDRRAALPVDAP